MYSVTDEYLTSMKGYVHRFKIKIDIGTDTFTDEDLISGSCRFSVANSDSDSVSIGTANIGEFKCTLRSDNITRYSLYGKTVTVSVGRLVDDEYIYIQQGVYVISDVSRSKQGFEISAYDLMSKFTKTFSSSYLGNSASVYDWLALACKSCGVTLGMTSDECAALPNGGNSLTLYSDATNVETWQDMLIYLSAACSAWAQMDRYGQLVLKTYKSEAVDTISISDRHVDCKFADYVTEYTYVSLTNIESAINYVEGEGDGLVVKLGENPFLQYSNETQTRARMDEILESILNIKYVPFTLYMMSEVAYELGDVVSCTGGLADDDELFCINSIDWTYDSQMTIEGTGSDPALADARSKVEKELSGILAEVQKDQSTFYIYNTSNVAAKTITEETTILDMDFVTVDDTIVATMFTIDHDMSLDGNIIARVYIDNVLFDTWTNYEDRGENVLTVSQCYTVSANITYNIKVTIEPEYFKSDIREALIAPVTWGELSDGATSSTEPPTITLEGGMANLTVFGRGLAASDVWGGKITIVEALGTISVENAITVTSMTDSVTIDISVPVTIDIAETLSNIDITNDITVNALADAVVFVEPTTNWTLSADNATYSTTYVDTSDGFKLRTEYEYTSEEETVDIGKMVKVGTDTTVFEEVTSIEVSDNE